MLQHASNSAAPPCRYRNREYGLVLCFNPRLRGDVAMSIGLLLLLANRMSHWARPTAPAAGRDFAELLEQLLGVLQVLLPKPSLNKP